MTKWLKAIVRTARTVWEVQKSTSLTVMQPLKPGKDTTYDLTILP